MPFGVYLNNNTAPTLPSSAQALIPQSQNSSRWLLCFNALPSNGSSNPNILFAISPDFGLSWPSPSEALPADPIGRSDPYGVSFYDSVGGYIWTVCFWQWIAVYGDHYLHCIQAVDSLVSPLNWSPPISLADTLTWGSDMGYFPSLSSFITPVEVINQRQLYVTYTSPIGVIEQRKVEIALNTNNEHSAMHCRNDREECIITYREYTLATDSIMAVLVNSSALANISDSIVVTPPCPSGAGVSFAIPSVAGPNTFMVAVGWFCNLTATDAELRVCTSPLLSLQLHSEFNSY